MKALDLKGKTFGELTAFETMQVQGKRGWLCQCTCGETREVPTFQLTAGHVRKCNNAANHLDIKLGDRFGKLTVTALNRDKRNRRWVATYICDCSNEGSTGTRNLQRGAGATTHCGCSTDFSNMGLPAGESARNSLLSSYKHNAKTKGREFTLTDEQCDALFQGDCHFCGQEPSEVVKKKGVKANSYRYNGIDRTDSDQGYTPENTKSCCTACNYLKGNRKDADFLYHIKRIANHNQL